MIYLKLTIIGIQNQLKENKNLINLNSSKKTISKNLIKITNKYPRNILYKYYFNLL